MPKFAANLTMMFTELAFSGRFAAAARAGFTGVEFLFPYDHAPAQVACWLEDHALENVAFNLPPGDWNAGERGLASLPGREAEFREGVARALEYAEVLGTPRLHAMAGIVPAGADRALYRDTYLRNLAFAAAELSTHGRTLLIEPINPRDIPGFFLNTQAEAHAIREEIGAPNLKVQMDFYHAQIVEGDVTTTFRQYFGGIGHLQLASVPARHEPDEGELDYQYVLKVVDEMGYEGWVGCEYRPRARTEDGLGWLAAFRAAPRR
ncbi:MAG: 2-oxo-tetronate isomerase [Acidobacteriota bacterium]